MDQSSIIRENADFANVGLPVIPAADPAIALDRFVKQVRLLNTLAIHTTGSRQ
jgi:hypothetical protein